MKKWHSIEKETLLKMLESSPCGLSSLEAQIRLSKYGKNELPSKRHTSFFQIMGRQLLDPIVLLLAIASLFSFFIGEIVDAGAILFIILVDLLLGTFQEFKASLHAESLANMIRVKSKVFRDTEILVDSSTLVVGDVVFLESGDKVCADMRILDCYNLTVQESILTGESVSTCKRETVLEEDTLLAERVNMLYAGTTVLTGRASAVVCETGNNTEIGKIATAVHHTKETKSPLTIRMEKFSKQISLFILFIAIFLTILLFMKHTEISQIFLSVVALSVSAMPEGLPLALTMALTIASNRMARKHVIVKKLSSVESLGSCTVIASDKTGTLTVNEQTAKKILLPSGDLFEIEGTGYNDKGSILHANGNIDEAIFLSKLGMLNNEASLTKSGDTFSYFGDSIDVAFLALALKFHLEKGDIETLGMIPYESSSKYSACFYKEKSIPYVTMKGSFEKVLSFCDHMIDSGKKKDIDRSFLLEQNEGLSKDGYRVIALAYQEGIEEKEEYKEEDIPSLTFVGMVGFIDPIREEAKASITACKKAGIRVLMITGDHPLTAFSIAKELSIVSTREEMATGEEVSLKQKEEDSVFDAFVREKRLFTRVTPTDKLKIIESLKRMGEFVAVTGDGVNDAPALLAANIGVAMGSGTDVALDAASMVLTDDNFTSIVAGIKEGRNAYSNIRKVSYMLLSCGFAEVIFFVLAILFHYPMPLVAIQLLWLNIVTDGLQDFALSFEKAEDGIMCEKPRSPKESVFNKELFIEVLLAGGTMGISIFGTWIYLISFLHMDISLARGYIMTLMVFMQNMHVLNCRSERNSIFQTSLFSNPLVFFSITSAILLQFFVCEVPVFGLFLQTSSIPISHMLFLLLVSSIIIFVMEFYKKIRKKWEKTSKNKL